jgi:hypothetical protein
VSSGASQEVIIDAIVDALEDAALTGASPDETLGEEWTVRVSGRTLSGDGIAKLYTGITATLPTGDIILDLSGCGGTSIAFANLVGSVTAKQAIRDRIVAITLPDTVTTIKNGTKEGNIYKAALSNFSRLREVSGSGVITIGNDAFRDCIALTAADFPLAVTVGESAFFNCTALVTGYFPNVTTFGNYAFNGCTTLSTLVLGVNPPTMALIFNNLASQAITFRVPTGRKPTYDTIYSAKPWGGGTGLTVTIVEEAAS